jgi:hypothetical protein
LAFLAAAGLAALDLGLLLPMGLSADLAALRLDTDALIAATLDLITCTTMLQGNRQKGNRQAVRQRLG